GNSITDVETDRPHRRVVARAGAAGEVRARRTNRDLLRGDVARVAKEDALERTADLKTPFERCFPERKPAERNGALLGREVLVAAVHDRIEEADIALRTDSSQRIAAVLARTAGEKAAKENELDV